MSSGSSGGHDSAHSIRRPFPIRSPSTPLESLLPHILAAKRSLSSISHVYRANELCTSTRASLEKSAILTARTSFLRSGIVSQLDVLQQVHSNTQETAKEGREEFESIVLGLDRANAQLRGTLDTLRGTIVEAGLRPEKEEKRSLLDFVDEGGVDGLLDTMKGVIEEAGEGFEMFDSSNVTFRDQISRARRTLNSGSATLSDLELGEKRTIDSNSTERSPIPAVLQEMENHARDMAGELEGLVRHYDMCVTAVKYTEGGGDVALKVANDLPKGVDVGQDSDGAPPEPISDEQREEMMAVLEEDAEHVEGAVMDIRSHIANMEALHEQIETYLEALDRKYASTTAAFSILEEIGRKLPNYVAQSQAFVLRWDAAKAKVDELLEELEGLTQFYGGFLRAYDNLLIEIGRRKNMELKMEKEVHQARARLEKLYDDDFAEREAFSKEQGDFLPVDIWPGLTAGPLRFEMTSVEDEAARVPDISKSVIHRAIRRIHGEQ